MSAFCSQKQPTEDWKFSFTLIVMPNCWN